MEYANTFRHEISLLTSRVVDAIETNLKRIGLNHSGSNDEPLEFLTFSTTVENDIEGINADGTLKGTEGTIRGAIEDDIVSIQDAIALLENLEEI